jgi:hypothetical protein
MSDRNMVDMDVNAVLKEALGLDIPDAAPGQSMSKQETEEIQAGLNVLKLLFPSDIAEELKTDGIFGPKTEARLKTFVATLPSYTQDQLKKELGVEELDLVVNNEHQ